MKKEFLEKIEGLEKQLADLKKEALADDSTAKYNVGGWYADSYNGKVFRVTKIQGTQIHIEHPAGGVEWFGLTSFFDSRARPATPTEIQSALVAEATKRGYKPGQTLKQLRGCSRIIPAGKENYEMAEQYDMLMLNGTGVYFEGQWAEIISEPQVTIAGHKVEYSGECCYINSTQYKKEDLQTLAFLLKNTDVKSLNVGCTGQHKVSHEHIKHILDNWK